MEYFNILLRSMNSHEIFQYILEECKLIYNILIYSTGVQTDVEYFDIFLKSVKLYRLL